MDLTQDIYGSLAWPKFIRNGRHVLQVEVSGITVE